MIPIVVLCSLLTLLIQGWLVVALHALTWSPYSLYSTFITGQMMVAGQALTVNRIREIRPGLSWYVILLLCAAAALFTSGICWAFATNNYG